MDRPNTDSFSGLVPAKPGFGEVYPSRKYAIIGFPGQGKTILLIYLALKELRDHFWNQHVWSYIRVYEGDPWNVSNPFPTKCDGTCESCRRGDLTPGHKFFHHARKEIRYWNQIEHAEDGVLCLDEASEYVPSEEWQSNRTKNQIIKNFRKRNLSAILTEQYEFKIDKKLRNVVSDILVPKLNIARTSDGRVDFDNSYVKNHTRHREFNCLTYLHFKEHDPDWRNYQNYVNGKTHDLEGEFECDIVPSVLFHYYETKEPVRVPYAPELSIAEADRQAALLYTHLKEENSYLWKNWLSIGESIPNQDYYPYLKAWNMSGQGAFSSNALNLITVRFREYCARIKTEKENFVGRSKGKRGRKSIEEQEREIEFKEKLEDREQ